MKSEISELIEISKFYGNNIDYVIVSIDSDNPQEHDEIRNSPGLFDKLVDGIKELKAKRNASRPLIKSTTVIYRNNLVKIAQILESLRSIVDITSIQPIVGGYASGPHGKTDATLQNLTFGKDDEHFVQEVFDRLIREHNDFNNNYFKLIPRYWFHKEDLVRKIRCWSPFLRMQILPNGDTFHCTAHADFPRIGNIKTMSILEIWNSPEMVRQRESIRLHKNNCICWTQDASFNAVLDSVPCIKMTPNLNISKFSQRKN